MKLIFKIAIFCFSVGVLSLSCKKESFTPVEKEIGIQAVNELKITKDSESLTLNNKTIKLKAAVLAIPKVDGFFEIISKKISAARDNAVIPTGCEATEFRNL